MLKTKYDYHAINLTDFSRGNTGLIVSCSDLERLDYALLNDTLELTCNGDMLAMRSTNR